MGRKQGGVRSHFFCRIFSFFLPPSLKKSITPELQQPQLTTDNIKKSKLILIVEDDLDLARIFLMIFTHHGFNTMHAVNGHENVTVNGTDNDPEVINFCRQLIPDLLILDLAMHSIKDYVVVKWLRDHFPQFSSLPLLIYSAQELNNQEQVILRLGKMEFLTNSRISPRFLE